MAGGRPKKVTKAIGLAICERVADGETVRQIGADPTMPDAATIYRAAAADPEFCEQYARAREAQLLRWEDELVEIADDGSNDWMERRNAEGDALGPVVDHEHISRSKLRVDARKWLMSKRAPKKYGDRVAVDGDGEGGPIRTVSRVEVVIVDPEEGGAAGA